MNEAGLKLKRLYRQRQSLENLIRAVEEYALVMGAESQRDSVMALISGFRRKPNGIAAAAGEKKRRLEIA